MVIIKSDADSEAGKMPSEKLLSDMQAYNEELVKAGIMLDGEGLHPTSKAKRVRLSKGNKITVIDGPFSESKELIAGYWIWRVKSMDEAVEWVKRMPADATTEGDVDIRPIFETEEFGAELTPELRAADERLRAELARQQRQ
jgi:hypothetical protein